MVKIFARSSTLFCKLLVNQNQSTCVAKEIYSFVYITCCKCFNALIFLLLQPTNLLNEILIQSCILMIASSFCPMVVITNYGPIKFMKVYVSHSNYNFMLIIPNLASFYVRVYLSPLLLSLVKLIFFRFSLNSVTKHYI